MLSEEKKGEQTELGGNWAADTAAAVLTDSSRINDELVKVNLHRIVLQHYKLYWLYLYLLMVVKAYRPNTKPTADVKQCGGPQSSQEQGQESCDHGHSVYQVMSKTNLVNTLMMIRSASCPLGVLLNPISPNQPKTMTYKAS
jgi:hypothetical protein